MEPILSTQALSFRNQLYYPDMNIPKHEVTFISGPSGCGKSTLFKLLNATLSPASGKIYYAGTDITNMDKVKLRREVLLACQSPYLFRSSIKENYSAFHQIHESTCPDNEEIKEYLRICCIDVPPDTPCEHMSGGERQRIFLSIALSFSPSVLLLDEPTSALHAELSAELLQHIILHAQKKQTTLLIISHDQNLQHIYAQNIIKLEPSS